MHAPSRGSRRIALAAAVTAAVLGLAGCGSDSSDSPGTGSPADATSAAQPSAGSSAAAQPGAAALTRPVIKPGTGTAPTKLTIKDDVVGTGAEAVAGKTVSVQYAGAAFDTGKEFDASWERGEPFQFPLGAGQVIPGWDQGVAGMKVGGRRTLVIPPDLGYGAAGAPPAIEPNETLVFVVDLLSVT